MVARKAGAVAMDRANHFRQPNAERLARRIEAFWKSKGFHGARAWAEPHTVDQEFCGRGERREVFLIRSNIGPNGYPPVLPVDGKA